MAWPGLPSALIDHDTFRARVRELGLREASGLGEYDCVTRILVEHPGLRALVLLNGFGAGYGGRRPVRVLDVRVETPREPSEQQLHTLTDLVAKLAAHAPIHDFHPAAIEERLGAFLRGVMGRPFHVVSMPAGLVLPRAFDHATRLADAARAAAARGGPIQLVRQKSGPMATWPVVFRGEGAALVPKAAELAATLDGRYLFIHDSAEARLELRAGLTARDEAVRRLADRFAEDKRARRTNRVELDASGGKTPIAGGTVPEIKAQLESFVDAAFGPITLRIAGAAETVKPDKLVKLATVLRGHLQEGKPVELETPTYEADDFVF